jgi:hypothetical protein
VLACLFFLCTNAVAQKAQPQKWLDSLRVLFSGPALKADLRQLGADTILKIQPGISGFADTSLLAAFRVPVPQQPELPRKHSVRFTGGSISYNFNYRSNIDTPFQEASVSQHLVSGQFNFTLSETVPVTLSYFERQSNSLFFRDYRDLRIELNAPEFQKIKTARINGYLDKLAGRLRHPLVKPALQASGLGLTELSSLLGMNPIVTKMIRSKAELIGAYPIDTSLNRDSALNAAKAYLELYDRVKETYRKAAAFRDSLLQEQVRIEQQVAWIRKLASARSQSLPDLRQASELLKQYGISDPRGERMLRTLSSVRTLALGRTIPNHSDLTLRNININGINFEYNNGIYLALAAGAVDLRTRDFIHRGGKRPPQFVYSARVGYGSREGNHVIFTGFKGRKQLYSSGSGRPGLDIYGLSFSTQLLVANNHRISAELAQSYTSGYLAADGLPGKGSFRLDDRTNKAFSFRVKSAFPKMFSRVELFYQHRGINFQSFSNYYTNAAQTSWQLKLDQYLWKKRLQLKASVMKNSFENPFVLTRYNGNTLFKNISLSFRKRNWPSLSAGYMPSSQLSEVGGQVYENFYHTFNVLASHRYRIGTAEAYSLATYNQFFNDRRDTGFLYYNARNIYLVQNIYFQSFWANAGISRTQNPDHTLTIFDIGAHTKMWKQGSAGLGAKINQLNGLDLRTGIYGSLRMELPKIGVLQAYAERSFLPGSTGNLFKTEFYSIGFTRFLTKSL